MKVPPFVAFAATCTLFADRLRAGPANDNFADRIFLTVTNVTTPGDNSGAGEEPGEDIEGRERHSNQHRGVWLDDACRRHSSPERRQLRSGELLPVANPGLIPAGRGMALPRLPDFL